MDPNTLEKVWDRYLQRYDEFLTQDAGIRNLVSQGKITLDPNGLIRDAATGKPFGSDWDLFNILKDGQQVPKAVHDAFISDCIKAGLPIRHGTLADWANMFRLPAGDLRQDDPRCHERRRHICRTRWSAHA